MSFDRNYGGPAISVSKLAESLTLAGTEVELWAPDGSVANNVYLTPGSSVRRLASDRISLQKAIIDADVVHDNGIWMPHNHYISKHCRKSKTPRIVSLRGMLLPWAAKHKRLKKWIAWQLYQRTDLEHASLLHATSDTERHEIIKIKLRRPVAVVPNCLELATCQALTRIDHGINRVALFLGRLYPVKGLPMLLEAWAQVDPGNWHLKIAGPDEAGHLAELERLVDRLHLSGKVSFAGPVHDEAKFKALSEASLFILPSYSENFGMAVAEALSCDLPVITTTGTPWNSLIDHKCGWWVEPNTECLAHAIREATQTSAHDLRQMGLRGKAFVNSQFECSSVAKRMLQVYENAISNPSGNDRW